MKIYAYDDIKFWGKQLVMAAGRAGIECVLFTKADRVPEGAVAFVRLDQQKEQRDICKAVVAALAKRKVITLPTTLEAELYDDKLTQTKLLGSHMPQTWQIHHPNEARALLERMALPFISKASVGAGSRNVRFVTNKYQAAREIEAAFGKGIPISYNRVQKGYLLWQQFVEGNDCDYRVCVVGNDYFGLVRHNRPDVPFASGSNNSYPLTLDNDRERAAFQKAVEVTRELGTKLMAYDVVFDGENPLLLEVSSAWTAHHHASSPCFNVNMERTGQTRGHLFDLILKAMIP